MKLWELLLPNWAFFGDRVRALQDRARLKYWALRIALAILAALAILIFGIQQHPQLH